MKLLLASTMVFAMTATAAFAETNLTRPGDMPDAAQEAMTTHLTDYNKCMMESRLKTSKNGQEAQQHANEILQSCESHLEDLRSLFAKHDVNPQIAEGMTKNMRSRAARQLMAKTMNNLAAQAAASANADQMESSTE